MALIKRATKKLHEAGLITLSVYKGVWGYRCSDSQYHRQLSVGVFKTSQEVVDAVLVKGHRPVELMEGETLIYISPQPAHKVSDFGFWENNYNGFPEWQYKHELSSPDSPVVGYLMCSFGQAPKNTKEVKLCNGSWYWLVKNDRK